MPDQPLAQPELIDDGDLAPVADSGAALRAAEDQSLKDDGGRVTLPQIAAGDADEAVVPPEIAAAEQPVDTFAEHVASTSKNDLLTEVQGDNDRAQRVLDAEQARGDQARSTLVEALQKQIAGE